MATAVTQETILEALRQVPSEHGPGVLDYMNSLQAGTPTRVDHAAVARLAATTWTAVAPQQWPRPGQDAVLREQAARLVVH